MLEQQRIMTSRIGPYKSKMSEFSKLSQKKRMTLNLFHCLPLFRAWPASLISEPCRSSEDETHLEKNITGLFCIKAKRVLQLLLKQQPGAPEVHTSVRSIWPISTFHLSCWVQRWRQTRVTVLTVRRRVWQEEADFHIKRIGRGGRLLFQNIYRRAGGFSWLQGIFMSVVTLRLLSTLLLNVSH